MKRCPGAARTRQTFTLSAPLNRGSNAGNERLVCRLASEDGVLVLWGTTGGDLRNIQAVEQATFPVTIECDWIVPDPLHARKEDRYWVDEDDHLVIVDDALTP